MNDDYESHSIRVLEGLEQPPYRPQMAITQSDDAMIHWADFRRQVDAEAMKLFEIGKLPRGWIDSVILGFNNLDESDVIDPARRAEAATALAENLGGYRQWSRRT